VDGSESLNLTPRGVDPTVYSWSQDDTRIPKDCFGRDWSQ